LSAGEVVMAQMYSGEALVAARDSGKPIRFVIPKEGGTLSIDNMVIPKDALHVQEAYELINYFYEATTQADLVKRMLSGPVVTGARAMLPAALQNNQVLYPSDEVLSHCEMMQDLGDATTEYDRIWAEIKANGP
jgi:spermidine/putrescine transport system substrate-binding protein